MFAKTAIILDTRSKKKDGTYPVKLRITFNRKQEYYRTPFSQTKEDFEKATDKKPRGRYKDISMEFDEIEQKAAKVIKDLGDNFSFEGFNKLYISNSSSSNKLEDAFNDYISTIEKERVGTISNYECARNSFKQFKPKANISDVTVRFLKDYEASMIKEERSVTTIGIYCRNLRSVLNYLIKNGQLNKAHYPFGASKDGKYEVPTSKNKKKALKMDDIAKIYNYECKQGSTIEMCRDYWMFIYLGNGINVKDFCLLKWKDINGNKISFIREKSKRTKKEIQAIQIIIQPEMQEIIDRWGIKTKSPKDYIFPHLKINMDAITIRDKVKLLTRLINDNMKRIAKELKIDHNITTYYARHSFATILKNSGAPVAMISQALGHSSLITTQNYLDGFEDEQLREATAALTAFKKKSK